MLSLALEHVMHRNPHVNALNRYAVCYPPCLHVSTFAARLVWMRCRLLLSRSDVLEVQRLVARAI